MTLTDAVIALFLAMRIHGTDAAIRATAKRCAKRLSRRERDVMFKIVSSKSPRAVVSYLAISLNEGERGVGLD
ncbi:DUF7740 domain-containing protein [Pseudomonas sp. LRF_L74]|uniref:DUF7740 domain-containing protein n=1 Tax=Pseudomonas sp. LRF_L74 TaxID=3369422 RepID=UPI003F5E0CDC